MAEKLGFGYVESPYRYIAKYKDGKWGEGYLSKDPNIVLNESACVLQYAQTCFEGLKARRTKDGRIAIFRPDMNAKRLGTSTHRGVMPTYPEKDFIDGVLKVVEANKDVIPSYESGGSLYIRPYMFGTDPILGVKPANEYEFRIFVSPVGPYFSGKHGGVALRTCDYDRAAPLGTGNVKLGLNYAMSLYQIVEAHELGYAENLYLDPATRTFIEETGGANIFFITKDHEFVTPKSNSILPSITKDSIMYIAKNELGLKVTERPVRLDEIGDFVEAGLCGTAAVISAVITIDDHGKTYEYFGGEFYEDSICGQLRKILVDIQEGIKEGPEGWVVFL